jgi:putative transposase
MPRRARVVFAGLPHHVTQRGNHGQHVFFRDGDQQFYLDLLQTQVKQGNIEVIAYCLMPNHVHLILVPSCAEGLHHALKLVHARHAQRINRMRDLSGHLWQGRYYSSPLDENHLVNAVRYVELNPVRARMIDVAQNYSWSSAAGHCGIRKDLIVDAMRIPKPLAGITDWSGWLAAGIPDEILDTLRRHVRHNLPCGSAEFVERLERLAGRDLRYRPWGVNAGRNEVADLRENEGALRILKRPCESLSNGGERPLRR